MKTKEDSMTRWLQVSATIWIIGILLAMMMAEPKPIEQKQVYVEPEPQCWGCYVEIEDVQKEL